MAAITGGAGVVAAVGSKAHLIKKFQKVGDLLSDFAKATRKLKLEGKKRKAKGNSAKFSDMEADQVQAKKTNAHGAEDGKISTNNPSEFAWHTSDEAKKIQGVLNGIDPKYLNPDSRFGPAFYVAEEPGTTVAELSHHGVDAKYSIRFDVNSEAMKVLDLTDPEIARTWGYNGGPISSETKMIGAQAQNEGFNVIRFPSERANGGVNNAILDNFNEILKPINVSPVKP